VYETPYKIYHKTNFFTTIFYLFAVCVFSILNISNILNFSFIVESDSEIMEYPSEERFSLIISFEFSGTIPELTSTKHNGGNNTHHQFWPSAFPIFILSAS